MSKGGGLLLLGAAGLAALAAWRKRQAQRDNIPPVPTLAVDPSALAVNAATTDSLAARRLREQQAGLKVAGAIAATVGSLALTVASAYGWANIFANIANVASSILSSSFAAFAAVFVIFIVAIIIAGNVIGAIKSEQRRWRARLASFGGSYHQLNLWEFETAKQWLQKAGASYSVEVYDDYRCDEKFLADDQYFVRHWQRYALTNVNMAPEAWQGMQVMLRLASIDYFRRAGGIIAYLWVRWKVPGTWWGPGLPENMAVPNMSTVWANVEAGALWDVFPLIGGRGPAQTDNDLGTTLVSAPRTVIQLYSTALTEANKTPFWALIQKNNHWQAIMAGVSMVKFDEDPFLDDNPDRYAQALYERLGLNPATDRVAQSGAFFQFDPSFWGWRIVVSIMAVKNGDSANAVVALDPNTGQVLQSANYPSVK